MSRDTFLTPVLNNAALYLELLTQEQQPDTDNEKLKQAARAALSQIETVCRRPFLRAIYTYEFPEVAQLIDLPILPVDEVYSVSALDTIFTVDEDYEFRNNSRIWFLGGTLTDLFAIGWDDSTLSNAYSKPLVEVRFLAGYSGAANDEVLMDALVTQTIANYNRAAVLGLTTVDGGSGRGSLTLASNTGGKVIDTVEDMMASFVYYGPGQLLQTEPAPAGS